MSATGFGPLGEEASFSTAGRSVTRTSLLFHWLKPAIGLVVCTASMVEVVGLLDKHKYLFGLS